MPSPTSTTVSVSSPRSSAPLGAPATGITGGMAHAAPMGRSTVSDVDHAIDAAIEHVGHATEGLRSTRLGELSRWRPTPRVGTMIIAGTAVAYASTSIFVRHLTDDGLDVIAVAFFRFALTAIVLAPMINLSRAKRSATMWGLASGATMGLGWIVYVNTIDTAAVATAGVVQMTYPLFAVAAAWIFFSVRPTLRSLVSAVLIIVAAAIGLGAGLDGSWADTGWLFVAPATFGFSVSILTERLGPLDPLERLAPVALGAAVMLTPLLFGLDASEVFPRTPSTVAWVVAIGAISALIPMSLYAAAAPVVGTSRTASAGSLELPTMFIIGALIFGEAIGLRHIVAATIIIGAIAITRPPRTVHVIAAEDLAENQQLAGRDARAGHDVLASWEDCATSKTPQVDWFVNHKGEPDDIPTTRHVSATLSKTSAALGSVDRD